jgi:hypothetical protein
MRLQTPFISFLLIDPHVRHSITAFIFTFLVSIGRAFTKEKESCPADTKKEKMP